MRLRSWEAGDRRECEGYLFLPRRGFDPSTGHCEWRWLERARWTELRMRSWWETRWVV